MEHRNNIIIEITKHIITISMATIGLLVSGLSSVLKATYELSEFMPAICFFTLAVLLSIVVQAALVSLIQGEGRIFNKINYEHILISSWGSFLIGIAIVLYKL